MTDEGEKKIQYCKRKYGRASTEEEAKAEREDESKEERYVV